MNANRPPPSPPLSPCRQERAVGGGVGGGDGDVADVSFGPQLLGQPRDSVVRPAVTPSPDLRSACKSNRLHSSFCCIKPHMYRYTHTHNTHTHTHTYTTQHNTHTHAHTHAHTHTHTLYRASRNQRLTVHYNRVPRVVAYRLLYASAVAPAYV